MGQVHSCVSGTADCGWRIGQRTSPTRPIHAGEREAILLAQEIRADAVIMDEQDGRNAALSRQLRVTGTLGVLDEAAERGLLDFPKSVSLLKGTSFHATDKLYQRFLDRDLDRKNQGLRPR